MNRRQLIVLVLGLALALALVRYQPIGGENPFYDPVRESVAKFLETEPYRPPPASPIVNGIAALLVMLGTSAAVVALQKPVRRQGKSHHPAFHPDM